MPFERQNQTLELLPLAARTAEEDIDRVHNFSNPAALFLLRVTAVSGTGGLRFRFDFVENFSVFDAHHPFNITSEVITATGNYWFWVGPNARSLGFQDNLRLALPICLPERYAPAIEHVDASSYTYQLIEFLLIE